MTKSYKIGRDRKTGEIAPLKKALGNPRRYEIEHMPKKGYGDVK